MECAAKKSKTHCTCSCSGCEKDGNCCTCVSFHLTRQEIPGCFFTPSGEKSLDRSLANFLKDHSA